MLLLDLLEHATQRQFVFSHSWQVGDLVVWDNRCTLHRVASDFTGERVMQRVTVAGDRPVGGTGSSGEALNGR